MTTKPAGRTLAEFGKLNSSEEYLLKACRESGIAYISYDLALPKPENDDIIRAAFLRFLALGGDEYAPVHEKGVQLSGAWIKDVLDMEATSVPSGLYIHNCHFDIAPVFSNAKIAGTLNLSACKVPGLEGDRLACEGDLFLREGFTSTGTVRLLGAQIGGNLDCSGAKFDGKDGDALAADGMLVEGTFFFRNLIPAVDGIFLAASHVGCLADDEKSWGNRLVLDGFTYGSIIGVACKAPTDATTRIKWLNKQRPEHSGINRNGTDFRPQPWRQLAKVLREMGHTEDARQVSIKFEHRLREANLIGQTPKEWGKLRSWFYRKISCLGHDLFGILTGYGYRPLRLLAWMLGVWMVCGAIYWYAALNGVFAPSNPLVFQNSEYAVCRPDYVAQTYLPASAVQPSIQGAGNWYLCEKLREEYSGFSPLAYSLDVLLPLVDLQQETSWSPLIPTPNKNVLQELFAICDWKHATRLVLWFEILFGWVSSLLLVAVVSGLTKRREE